MIQATPFDLRLLTAATDETIQDYEAHYERVYTQFTDRRDWLLSTNRRLAKNPALEGYRLCVPLTNDLFAYLSDTPPWSETNRSTDLHQLKIQVLALLVNPPVDTIMYLNDAEIEHEYTLVNASGFFPSSLAQELCDAWITVTGTCGFEYSVANSVLPSPLYAVWCVSSEIEESKSLQISSEHILSGDSQVCNVPLFTQTNAWDWEFMVRKCLWQDTRLPFYGGPDSDVTKPSFGYRPSRGWQPGKSISKTDAKGAYWKWSGGRAVTEDNPFGGHWDVQLDTSSTRNQWTHVLENAYGRRVRWHNPQHPHINIQPTGQIEDFSFDLSD